ncbi:MAG: hypothetical protein K9G65_05180 [Rickettsiaceae bacterium]|nr:hypothetical protein [Rickettsiaceae bacterium]
MKKVFKFLKKVFTNHWCDSCGFTKDDVYVTEFYAEAGHIECKKCYNKRNL